MVLLGIRRRWIASARSNRTPAASSARDVADRSARSRRASSASAAALLLRAGRSGTFLRDCKPTAALIRRSLVEWIACLKRSCRAVTDKRSSGRGGVFKAPFDWEVESRRCSDGRTPQHEGMDRGCWNGSRSRRVDKGSYLDWRPGTVNISMGSRRYEARRQHNRSLDAATTAPGFRTWLLSVDGNTHGPAGRDKSESKTCGWNPRLDKTIRATEDHAWTGVTVENAEDVVGASDVVRALRRVRRWRCGNPRSESRLRIRSSRSRL